MSIKQAKHFYTGFIFVRHSKMGYSISCDPKRVLVQKSRHRKLHKSRKSGEQQLSRHSWYCHSIVTTIEMDVGEWFVFKLSALSFYRTFRRFSNAQHTLTCVLQLFICSTSTHTHTHSRRLHAPSSLHSSVVNRTWWELDDNRTANTKE